jgi:hypothetical protein
MSKQYSVSVKIGANVAQATKGIQSVSQHLKGLAGLQAKFGDMTRTVGRVGLGVAAVGGGIVAAMAPFVKTASQFENLNASLSAIQGSGAKAKQSLDWVSDFAAKTPYEIGEVADAFKKLDAYGLKAQGGLLKTLGDTSAAMGKPLMASIEAIADAITGENERLKEFGIKARKTRASKGEPGQISYEWVNKAGKQMLTTVDANNRKAIQSTLQMIWNNRYAGAMDNLSKTFSGKMSNLLDQWTRFKLKVMSGGAFNSLNKSLENVLNTLNRWADDGTMDKAANTVGQVFNTTVKAIAGMGPTLAKVGDALKPVWAGFVKFAGSDTKAIQLIVTGLASLAALQISGSILSFFMPTSLGQVATGLALTAASTVAWSMALHQLNTNAALAGLRGLAGGTFREFPSLGTLAAAAWGRVAGGLGAVWAVVQNLHPALKILGIVAAVGGIAVVANWGKVAPVLSNIWSTVTKVGQAVSLMVGDAIAAFGRWAMSFGPIRAAMSWLQGAAASVGQWFNTNLGNANRWADGVIAAHSKVNAVTGGMVVSPKVLPLAGARALGGPVVAGKPYLVGERGPELVVPRRNGTVVPNHQLKQQGGGELHIFVHGGHATVKARKGLQAKVTSNPGRIY